LKSIGDFDAIVMNQRDIRWFDMPKQSERRPEQYYIMWAYESPSYPGMDIHQLDNYFNWTMTYRRDSDFPFHMAEWYKQKNILLWEVQN
jgi:alpha-1,3-fucosyltransferase